MIFLFVVVLGVLAKQTVSTRVQLSTGTIEGKVLNATYSPFGNQSAIVFFGIPYVEPPIGDLRFRKPRPPIPWEGVLETKAYKPACMSNASKTYKNGNIGGPISEDCLYANVFTNHYCMMSRNCSVMIAIHGGGFLFESASAFNPEILINNFVGQDRNIVVVSLNYRLGVFGFGHFAGDQGDRNMGLFDIMAGVKWVRREIKNFGGNKDRITLAGHSAGAGLIVAFTNSPLTKGLIHQQVVMSGPLSNVSKKSNYKGMTKMAQMVGCLPEEAGFDYLSKEQVNKTYSCLRQKPAQELLDAQLYILQNTTYYFGAPHVDGEFIVDYPDRLFSAKSIFPINSLIGTTTAELRDTMYITNATQADTKAALLKHVCEHIGYEIYTEPEKFIDNCQKYYERGDEAQFLSDDMEFYSRAVSVASTHVSKNTKVYMYSYAYSGAGAAFNKYMPKIPSPHHSEDLIYIFGTHRGTFASKDYVIERIYSGVYANFINNEDPSPSEEQPWLQYTPEKREHFLFDFDSNFTMPGMKENYYADALKFWSTAGTKSFSECYSASFDTFIITNLVTPIVSHMTNVSTDVDKTFNQTEKLFFERESYLQELKLERKFESRKGNEMKKKGKKTAARMGNGQVGIEERDLEKEGEEGGSGINILLIIFAGTLLGGILYVTISHFCLHHRSREGYQLLK